MATPGLLFLGYFASDAAWSTGWVNRQRQSGARQALQSSCGKNIIEEQLGGAERGEVSFAAGQCGSTPSSRRTRRRRTVRQAESPVPLHSAHDSGAREEAAAHQVRVESESRSVGRAFLGAAALREDARPRESAQQVCRRPVRGQLSQQAAKRIQGGAGWVHLHSPPRAPAPSFVRGACVNERQVGGVSQLVFHFHSHKYSRLEWSLTPRERGLREYHCVAPAWQDEESACPGKVSARQNVAGSTGGRLAMLSQPPCSRRTNQRLARKKLRAELAVAARVAMLQFFPFIV